MVDFFYLMFHFDADGCSVTMYDSAFPKNDGLAFLEYCDFLIFDYNDQEYPTYEHSADY